MMNLKRSVVCLAMVVFATLVHAQKAEEVKDLIESERYRTAETILEKELENGLDEGELSYLLVKIYLEQDKQKEAEQYVLSHLPIALALSNEADPLKQIARARYLLNTGNKAEADQVFETVLSNKKARKTSLWLKAMAEVVIEEQDGDARKALEWLALAQKKDKDDPEIDLLRGLAYRKLGNGTLAYLAYQDAIKEDPRNVRAHYLLGKIFTAQKNTEVYMEHFTKAYQVDSTYAPVLEELYEHYYYRDAAQAKMYLEKFIDNSDYSIRNDYRLTDMLYLNKEYTQAILKANSILRVEKEQAQPRLYKLIAYSYAGAGDSVQALENMGRYMELELPERRIAPDYELMAILTSRIKGRESAAINYYISAAETDSVIANKADVALAIARLYQQLNDPANQAIWLGKYYQWKENTTNVDLFNWGIAWYRSSSYSKADSVFSIYTKKYPEDIYGFYWRAQASAAMDTLMTDSLAVPFYRKVVEIGEKDKTTHKNMLLKAYGYLGGYEANITKNYTVALDFFERYAAMDDNADVKRYIEMLQKWITEQKGYPKD